MYLEFYGLKEAPLSITPDPRYVFLSERHRDALAHLLYGIGKGGSGGSCTYRRGRHGQDDAVPAAAGTVAGKHARRAGAQSETVAG